MRRTIARRTIAFGKIACYGKRKENLVEIEMELRENSDGHPVFTACGNVWNRTHTDILMGGQCLDEIGHVPVNDGLFQEIVGLWQRYHLNDLNAGTQAQTAEIERAGLNWRADYAGVSEHLKKAGLFEAELTEEEKRWNPRYADRPYRYGSGWLYHPIPEGDLARIREIIEKGE